MSFHDIRFPLALSLAATGGPMHRTSVTTLGAGHEKRNRHWLASRRRYNAGAAAITLEDVETLAAFFEARGGRLHAFRWRDPFDWKSCALGAEPAPGDQLLGMGDATTTDYQLNKAYESGGVTVMRAITRPVAETVRVSVDGTELVQDTDFIVDSATGIVSFAVPPATGAVLTAGFEYDVPVRFDTDQLLLSFAGVKAGRLPDIPVIEVREPAGGAS